MVKLCNAETPRPSSQRTFAPWIAVGLSVLIPQSYAHLDSQSSEEGIITRHRNDAEPHQVSDRLCLK